MEVLLFKLNGWPDTYDERIRALARSTDITFIRSAPVDNTDDFDDLENVSVYDIYPRRGSYVSPSWLKPLVFSLHVSQAVLIAILISVVRRRQPDVIHALDYVLGGVAATAASALLQRPLVVSVRGYKEPVYRSILEENRTLLAKINYQILVLLSKFVLSRADYVITKAEYQREAVEQVVPSPPEFKTVPTGVDFEQFNPSRVDAQDLLLDLFPDEADALTEDHFRLLYFGQVIPQKGVDTLLKHVRNTSDALPNHLTIVIVGEFRTEEFKQKVENLRKEIDCQVLIFPSRIPFEKVPELLSSVDAVALLSEPAHEGVPRVLQEACAMQVPLIAADVPGITGAFAGLPGCNLVNREDASAFADAVTELYNKSPQMDRNVFKQEFDMYENYQTYAEVYRQCVERYERV